MADRIARFVEEADAELLDALAYYNERTPGAGDRLLEDVLTTASSICEDPERYPIEADGYSQWRCLVFPHSVRYQFATDGHVDVVAKRGRRGRAWTRRPHARP